MSDRFSLDPESIRSHADQIQGITESRIENAESAANEVGFGDWSIYGILLQGLIPPVLEACVGDAREAIAGMADGGSALAEALKDTADKYEEADTVGAEDFDRIAKDFN